MILFNHLNSKQEWKFQRVEDAFIRDRHRHLEMSLNIMYDGASVEKVEAFLDALHEMLKDSEEFQDGQGEQTTGVQQEELRGLHEESSPDLRPRKRIVFRENDIRGEGQDPDPKGK